MSPVGGAQPSADALLAQINENGSTGGGGGGGGGDVVVTSSVLPDGASTSAKQDSILAALGDLLTPADIAALATAAGQASMITALGSLSTAAKQDLLLAAVATAAKQDSQITQETAINTRLGEVQASPTANTVLDRLKALATIAGEVQASPTSNTMLDRLKRVETALTAITVASGAVGAVGASGIPLIAYRKDASGPLSGVADLDFSLLQVDANGALKVVSTGGGDASAANQTSQIAQIGEVQASPTANTVLDRLKVLSTILGATNGAKVVTDADGTLQQYLRGLVSLFANTTFDSTNKLRASLYMSAGAQAVDIAAASQASRTNTSLMAIAPYASQGTGTSTFYPFYKPVADSDGGLGSIAVAPLRWNDQFGWDRERGTTPLTLLSSAARTSTTNTSDQTIYSSIYMLFFINISANAGAFTLTPKVQYKDSQISNNYFDVLTGTALNANGLYMLAVGGGVPNVANLSDGRPLARTARLVLTPGDATSVTYSVSAVVNGS